MTQCLWTCRRAELQSEHMTEEEKGFKWLWNASWLSVPDGLVWVFHNLLLVHWWNHLWSLQRKGSKKVLTKRKYPASWKENASLMSGVRGQSGYTGWRPQKGNRNWNNQCLQPGCAECSLYKVWHPSRCNYERVAGQCTWLQNINPFDALTTFMSFIHQRLRTSSASRFTATDWRWAQVLTARVCSRPWNEEIRGKKKWRH